MSKTQDRFLAVVVAIGTLVLIAVFFLNSAFFEWAFTRHQNVASWMARPLLLLPFCYFSWVRSLSGIMISVLAILTSMFWFPVPAEPRVEVSAFLEIERGILQEGWSQRNIFGVIAVIAYSWALAASFWQRSWKIGLVVAAAGALLKVCWSIIAGAGAGVAVWPFALTGFLVLAAATLIIRRVFS